MKKTWWIVAMLLLCTAALAACSGGGATLSVKEIELTVGASYTLTASVKGKTEGLTWEAEDGSVAVVSNVTLSEENGEYAVTVRGTGVGETKVKLMQGEKEVASCTVKVEGSPLSVFIPEGILVLKAAGTASVRAHSEIALDEETAVWTTSDSAIGTVDGQGFVATVTAVKRGECTITVTCDKYAASFTLIVGIS